MVRKTSAGEVHLEMCLKDLKERFARIEIHASAPLVAFRESAFLPAEMPDAIPKPCKVRAATKGSTAMTLTSCYTNKGIESSSIRS